MIKLVIVLMLVVLSISNTYAKTNCKEIADNNLKKNQFWLLCEMSGGSSGSSSGNLVASGSEFQPVYRPKPKPTSFGYWGRR